MLCFKSKTKQYRIHEATESPILQQKETHNNISGVTGHFWEIQRYQCNYGVNAHAGYTIKQSAKYGPGTIIPKFQTCESNNDPDNKSFNSYMHSQLGVCVFLKNYYGQTRHCARKDSIWCNVIVKHNQAHTMNRTREATSNYTSVQKFAIEAMKKDSMFQAQTCDNDYVVSCAFDLSNKKDETQTALQ